jgi:hypothetical protein
MGELVLREIPDVPIWSVHAQESEIGTICDPLRPISSRSDNYGTSIFHDCVTLQICWINSDNYGTSIFHDCVTLQICWINSDNYGTSIFHDCVTLQICWINA